jgi:MoaA/NifB/PqqE/SkfB family radical SAM enzyme
MIETVLSNKQGILEECSQRSIRVEHLPSFYQIHLNMPCNQKCIMCVPDGKHKRDTLSFDEFVDLFDQIKPYAEHITLIGGETFMYPHIKEVLDLLAGYPIEVSICTNATMLTEKIIPRLLSLHGLNLRCSIDAVTRETYNRIRGRDVFDKVTSHMRRFAEASRDLPHIRMRLCYVVMRENLHEVLPFIDFAKTLQPYRVQFQPVKHVMTWRVQNGTGWTFDGREQSCESFQDEFNEVMRQAAEKCEREGLECDIQLV